MAINHEDLPKVLDPVEDGRALMKYESMINALYVQYAKDRTEGKILLKDSELYQKIIRGKMLIDEWKRQRTLGLYDFRKLVS